MKHIEDTPWWICDKDDENYCAYVDTDSNYFNAEPILKHLYPNFEEFTDKEKDDKLEKVALAYQDIINEDYDRLAKEAFNVTNHRLEMKTECVIRSAYFRATRRYAQWITKQEGIEKETLDIKGLEFMKANFPPILGDFFNDILQQVLKGAEKQNILNQIKSFKKQILDGSIPLAKLGNPTSVKKLDKYTGTKARAGEMFTEILKGAPAPVRAAIRYNDLLSSLPRAITEWGEMSLFDNIQKTDVVLLTSEAEALEAAARTIIKATLWVDWWTCSAKPLALLDSPEAKKPKCLLWLAPVTNC